MVSNTVKPDSGRNLISVSQSLDVKDVVEKNPQIGFSVVLQLTGVHGSSNFDNITKTKTVENVLASTSKDGIDSYVHHLMKQVNATDDEVL